MSLFPTGESVTVPPLRPFRIIAIDDDPLQLRALQRRARGHDRIELLVFEHAIDALLEIGKLGPDLVVMDVFMPGIDGIEACRRIRANPETREVHVVLASTEMTDELAASALEAGASQAVSKPIDLLSIARDTPGFPAPPARFASGTIPPPFTLERPTAEVPPPVLLRAADLVVDMIEEAGVDIVFGLPGGAISPVHDALLDSEIRVITTRHESGAMFAAAAHARATGKLAVVAVTSGPGVLNAMTGLASAWCDGVPVLLLVGEVPRAAHGKGVLQDGSAHGLQIVEMARHIAKLAVEVPSANALPHLLRRSIATALSGRRGPVVMTLPLDVLTAQIARPQLGGSIHLDSALAPASLDEIADLLRRARRPLILAGSGVRGDGAPERLRLVAERLGCPVATTPKGKGVFPESHPLALGVLGLGGHPSTRAYLDQGVDVVLAIGTSLGDLSTDGFSPQLQAPTFIHVDLDARQFGRSYAPTHAIIASATELLAGVAERLDARAPDLAPRRPASRVIRQHLPSSAHPDRIAGHEAIAAIQRILPADTIYTVDSGEHFVFAAHYLQIDQPDGFLVMTGLGSMGQSIGAAIGAQLANPERSVAAICGDGCFAMNAFEIATAVAERLPIRVFVFNDQRLGMVEAGHQNVYGRRPRYPTDPLDVCLVARGLGATTLRVDSVAQLAAAHDAIRDAPGPVVIDVQIDADLAVPKADRVAAMRPQGSCAFSPTLETVRAIN